MSTEKFNELGLTFKTLTPSDFDEISKFQMLYFFPDEPIARSTKLLEGSGIINKYISSLVKKHMIDPCLKDEVSVAAYNKDGEIIGVRLGYVFEQKMLDEEPNIRWMASMPKWCFPKKLITLGLLMKHNDTLRYGNEYALQDLENCTKYYHGQSLTVTTKARGMGLGKELIKRTNQIALDKGCSHVYICATSLYSQRIFQKLSFQVLHEMPYDHEDFVDKDGKPFFQDMREHKMCQVVICDLNSFDFTL